MGDGLGASQATGLAGAEAPEPCGLGSSSGIPSASPLRAWCWHEPGTRGDISKDEFCARFKAYMLQAGDAFDDGSSIAEYADETASSYWEDDAMENESPEACAAADMDYWCEE